VSHCQWAYMHAGECAKQCQKAHVDGCRQLEYVCVLMGRMCRLKMALSEI
jgi:hypothetical protein